MYTLHIANKNYSSWSLRPWVLMQTLKIPFHEVLTPFASDSWEAYQNFSPTGLVPCLVDGDTLVWDSLAITEYLAEAHDNIWPSERSARAWARCASAEMHSGFNALRRECSMNCGLRVEIAESTPALNKDLRRLDQLWQQGFEQLGGPFLAGSNFTAVDACFAPVAFRIQTFGLKLSDASMAYVQRLLELDAMQAWYADALQEPWREASHEGELNGKVILADLREPL